MNWTRCGLLGSCEPANSETVGDQAHPGADEQHFSHLAAFWTANLAAVVGGGNAEGLSLPRWLKGHEFP